MVKLIPFRHTAGAKACIKICLSCIHLASCNWITKEHTKTIEIIQSVSMGEITDNFIEGTFLPLELMVQWLKNVKFSRAFGQETSGEMKEKVLRYYATEKKIYLL